MNIVTMLRLVLVPLSVAFVAGCARGNESAGNAASGAAPDTVVNGSVEDQADTRTVDPLPVTTIGITVPAGDDSTRYELHRVVGAVVLDGGMVVVAHNDAMLALYDSTGRFLRQLGRVGDGPNEYRRVRGLTRSGSDALALDETGRVLRIDQRGELSTALMTPGRAPVAAIDAGNVVTTAAGFSDNPVASDTSRLTLMAIEYFRTRDGSTHTPIARLPVAYYTKEWGPHAYGPRGQIAAGSGYMVAGFSDRAELRVYDGNGSNKRVLRWAARRAPVTDEDADRYRAAMLRNEATGKPHTGGELELAMRMQGWMVVADSHPVFTSLLIDDRGGIWVESARPEDGLPIVDRYSSGALPRLYGFGTTGRLREAMTLPRMRPLDVTADRVAGLVIDDNHVESIAVYRTRRK